MRIRKTVFSRKKGYRGFMAVYSTHKIISSAILAGQVRNSSNSLLDIGFSSGIIDTSAITSHSSGSQSYFSRLYDQSDVNPAVTIDNAKQPYASTASGVGLDYLHDYAHSVGLYLNSSNLPLKMNKDWVIDYVFRNETQPNNVRTNLLIRTSKSGEQGNFSFGMYSQGATFNVQIRYLYNAVATANVAYSIPKGTSATLFTLFTFSYIAGVFKMYINGALQTPSGTVQAITHGLEGIYIGVGYSYQGLESGKINNFKTATLFCGSDLSNYDITAHINSMKSIHSIT